MSETKILHIFSGVAGVFFPAGKLEDGGTCEFASCECLEKCAAFSNATNKNKIGYQPKYEALEFITKQPIFVVCNKILEEMSRLESRILYWFAAGDCMRRHTQRIASIMRHLSLEGVIQCGFTRNRTLWGIASEISGLHLALTIEDEEAAKKLSNEGIVVIPDYESEKILFYFNTRHYGSCGVKGYNDLSELSIGDSCKDCYKNRLGCFARTEKDSKKDV